VLGVTGKYCSGKNALVTYLQSLGFTEIDVDKVGHQLLGDGKVEEKLRRHFGDTIFTREGTIDRRALGQRVFRDIRELRVLESIIHPPMVRQVELTLEKLSGSVVLNAAVLFRMGLEQFCHVVVCVRAPLLQRVRRARRRDRSKLIRVLRRMRAQRGICSKLNANGVDIYYVDNDRGLDHLHTQILKILREKGQKTI
jgi:dephospho-CoA kinase